LGLTLRDRKWQTTLGSFQVGCHEELHTTLTFTIQLPDTRRSH